MRELLLNRIDGEILANHGFKVSRDLSEDLADFVKVDLVCLQQVTLGEGK